MYHKSGAPKRAPGRSLAWTRAPPGRERSFEGDDAKVIEFTKLSSFPARAAHAINIYVFATAEIPRAECVAKSLFACFYVLNLHGIDPRRRPL